MIQCKRVSTFERGHTNKNTVDFLSFLRWRFLKQVSHIIDLFHYYGIKRETYKNVHWVRIRKFAQPYHPKSLTILGIVHAMEQIVLQVQTQNTFPPVHLSLGELTSNKYFWKCTAARTPKAIITDKWAPTLSIVSRYQP